jgi:ELWxxDGT repeat protein
MQKAILTALALFAGAAQAQYSLQMFNIESSTTLGSKPFGYSEYIGKAYFYTDLTQEHLYVSDGISYTPMVNPNQLTNDGMEGFSFCQVKEKLYFTAKKPGEFHKIYEFDGANAPVAVVSTGNYVPSRFVDLKEKLYYIIEDGLSRVEYYDPIAKTTNLVTSMAMGGNVKGIIPFNDKLIISCDMDQGAGVELYRYDPQAGNVSLVADINSSMTSSTPQNLMVANGKLYFIAHTDAYGRELYEYDGTTAPVRVTDINPGTGSSFDINSQRMLGAYNNAIYFSAKSSSTNTAYALYKYESGGTPTLVHDFQAGNPAAWFEVYGKRLFFVSDSNNVAVESTVYMYDGTNTPVSIATVTGKAVYNPSDIKAINGRLFFTANELLTNNNFEPFVFTDTAALDVEDVLSASGMLIYPNPATTEVTISFTLKQASKLTVTLTDMQGRVVYSETKLYDVGRNDVVVPVREVAAGVYTYAVMGEDGVMVGSGRIVKK